MKRFHRSGLGVIVVLLLGVDGIAQISTARQTISTVRGSVVTGQRRTRASIWYGLEFDSQTVWCDFVERLEIEDFFCRYFHQTF